MENWESSQWLAALAFLVIAAAIWVFVMRWVFSVGKHIRQQEVMIDLLMKIASGETMTKEQKAGLESYLERN